MDYLRTKRCVIVHLNYKVLREQDKVSETQSEIGYEHC